MNKGDQLIEGEFLASQNEEYLLMLTFEGSLQLSYDGVLRVLWKVSVADKPGKRFSLDTNGNLVLYDNTNLVVWQTATRGRGEYLVLENNANLVLYDANGFEVWSSGTASSKVFNYF